MLDHEKNNYNKQVHIYKLNVNYKKKWQKISNYDYKNKNIS